MSVIDNLIYDRTQADVDRVKELKRRILDNGWNSLSQAEKTEYLAGMKGAYNATDLNRVGQAIAYIATYMEDIEDGLTWWRNAKGVAYDSQFALPVDMDAVEDINPKTNWTISDIPTKAQADKLLGDISILRGTIPLAADAPSVPTSLDGLDYLRANDIEYLLYAVYQSLDGLENDIADRIDQAADAWMYSSETNCGG